MITVFWNNDKINTVVNLYPVSVVVVVLFLAVRSLPSLVFSYPVVTLTEKKHKNLYVTCIKEVERRRRSAYLYIILICYLSQLPVSVSLLYITNHLFVWAFEYSKCIFIDIHWYLYSMFRVEFTVVTIFERSISYLCANMKFSDELRKTSILMYCISAMIYIYVYVYTNVQIVVRW